MLMVEFEKELAEFVWGGIEGNSLLTYSIVRGLKGTHFFFDANYWL